MSHRQTSFIQDFPALCTKEEMFLCLSGCWERLSSVQQSDDAPARVRTSPAGICETQTHAQDVCQSLRECPTHRGVRRVPCPAGLPWGGEGWEGLGGVSQGCPGAGETLGASSAVLGLGKVWDGAVSAVLG